MSFPPHQNVFFKIKRYTLASGMQKHYSCYFNSFYSNWKLRFSLNRNVVSFILIAKQCPGELLFFYQIFTFQIARERERERKKTIWVVTESSLWKSNKVKVGAAFILLSPKSCRIVSSRTAQYNKGKKNGCE